MTLPGLDTWLTQEGDLDALAPDYAAEELRERRWASFEQDCAMFAEAEPLGWVAVLQAVARAMKQQKELPL